MRMHRPRRMAHNLLEKNVAYIFLQHMLHPKSSFTIVLACRFVIRLHSPGTDQPGRVCASDRVGVPVVSRLTI